MNESQLAKAPGHVISFRYHERGFFMKNFLIRGISIRLYQKVQKFSRERNLSANQLLLDIIDREIERMKGNVDEEKQRAEAFRRLREIREELSRKYGKQED